jgi:hypothetical protein
LAEEEGKKRWHKGEGGAPWDRKVSEQLIRDDTGQPVHDEGEDG